MTLSVTLRRSTRCVEPRRATAVALADHPPISGLPKIGISVAQVGHGRLAWLASLAPQDDGRTISTRWFWSREMPMVAPPFLTRVAVVMSLIVASAAAADPVADFYKSRNVSLIIGFGIGGDDDLWGRLVGKHIGRHIPGTPTVTVTNLPGAAGLVLINRLANASPRDGTVVGMINRGIPFEPLLGGGGTQFDPLKMTYIGSPNRDTTV